MSKSERRLNGISVVAGRAVGTAYRVPPRVRGIYPLRILRSECQAEYERFRQALEQSRRQLLEIRDKLREQVGQEHSSVIDAHLLMLEDRHFLNAIEERILHSHHSAERAIDETAHSWLTTYTSLEDSFFRERGFEFEEVAQRLAANLRARSPEQPGDLPEDIILVSDRMSLLVMADYGLERIRGLVLGNGGRTSHVAIVARSCRIPIVAGIAVFPSDLRTGATILVDGDKGAVVIGPRADEAESLAVEMKRVRRRIEERQVDSEPCRTADGQRVVLLANTESPADVDAALRLGAEGIGLYRTEFLYIENKNAPASEKRQLEAYRDLGRRLHGRSAAIRTLDIGDEDHPYFSTLAGASQPILGLRGVRLGIRYPEILKAQIRAIVRARASADLSIVLPMVTSPDEVRQVRGWIAEEERALGVRGPIRLGVLIEVPAAVYCLKGLAEAADFFAVGTNDLIQFTLAVSRTDERASDLYDPWHPAVLESLSRIAAAAETYGKPAVCCGEAAADPAFLSLLVGMGFRRFSMTPYALPDAKACLRQCRTSDLADLVRQALSLKDLSELSAFRESAFPDAAPVHVEA